LKIDGRDATVFAVKRKIVIYRQFIKRETKQIKIVKNIKQMHIINKQFLPWFVCHCLYLSGKYKFVQDFIHIE